MEFVREEEPPRDLKLVAVERHPPGAVEAALAAIYLAVDPGAA